MKKILFLTLIGILICSSAYALNLSRVKTWNASDVLTASDLNAEFDNIVNHAIVNADISASAAITASKLDLTIGTPIGSTTASTGAFTTLTASGATTLNGDTTIGNATGDALTFHPSAWTLTNAVTVTGTWTNLGTVTTATINGGTITGITDLVVADGGTGASTLTDGGILLGSGTGAITATAVLADGEILVGDGTTDPVAESGATLRTSIGVAIGTNVQAYDADLDDLADGSISVTKVSGAAASGSNTDITSLGGLTDVEGAKNICKVIPYTGTGATQSVAHGLGRTPVYVVIGKADTNNNAGCWWISGMQSGYSHIFGSGPTNTEITGVDGTNVTLHASAQNNQSGHSQIMIVF